MLNVRSKFTENNFQLKQIKFFFLACSLQLLANSSVSAQDNSPYSRYGLGDLHPNSNILNRGMAGISAAYSDQLSVNFFNPASYSKFYTLPQAKTKKIAYGRILLDVGLNSDKRTLRETNNPQKYTISNTYFSYLQLGIPVKKNIGIVFGLRPISKINYKIGRQERLYNPQTGLPIDSAFTEFTGNGGAFLFNTGTGFAIKNFSAGINAGYLFGRKEYSTRRIFLNDTVAYERSNHQTTASFGGLFFNAGMQYRIDLKKDKSQYFQIGIVGNTKQKIKTNNDIIRETYYVGSDGNEIRVDSVSQILNTMGKVSYPASFGGGFLLEKEPDIKHGGLLIGIDFMKTNWNDYRFNGKSDSVKTNWTLKIGAQIRPSLKEARYKNFISYRAGLFFGNDYVYLNKKLPQFGLTAGLSLPIANLKDAQRRFRTQYSIVNISAEYIRRGNKENLLRENFFRLSVGFTLSDLWFTKHKYE